MLSLNLKNTRIGIRPGTGLAIMVVSRIGVGMPGLIRMAELDLRMRENVIVHSVRDLLLMSDPAPMIGGGHRGEAGVWEQILNSLWQHCARYARMQK